MRISVEEAAKNFAALLDKVRLGEEVTIVDGERPVAMLRPAPSGATPANELYELRKDVSLGMPIAEAITQGRRY